MTPDDLVELRLIEELKYRYLRAVDQKDWDLLRDCFVDEAVAVYGGGAYRIEGADAIVEFLRGLMDREGVATSHRCHHPEITLHGDGTATGLWALEDRVIDTEFGITLRGAAWYTDEYRHADAGWKLTSTAYKRTFEELEPRRDETMLTASWWTTDGRTTLDYAGAPPAD